MLVFIDNNGKHYNTANIFCITSSGVTMTNGEVVRVPAGGENGDEEMTASDIALAIKGTQESWAYDLAKAAERGRLDAQAEAVQAE